MITKEGNLNNDFYFQEKLMKKEVPPFGVLAADYDPEFHVIVRPGHNSVQRAQELPRGKFAD